jgi:putative ABC transport system permease protein
VRVAIGASRGRLIGAVAATWLSRVALGIAVGLAAALALGRSVESLLHGVQATDPATLLAASALLAAVAAVACWIPTRRALAIDPKEALRAE